MSGTAQTSGTLPDEAIASLGLGDYLLGAAWMLAFLGAMALVGLAVRRLLLPGWGGAPARLAEAVVAIFAALALSEILGTFGLFEALPVLVVALLAGLISALTLRSHRDGPAPPRGKSDRRAVWVAIGLGAVMAAGWGIPTFGALAAGMDRADSLWYHMPLSVEFVQTASTGAIHQFDPIFFAGFYPANSELLHAIPILAFGRDFVSPFINIGFLGLSLLAAWSIGRPFGVAPLSLIGASLIVGSQSLIEFQAGESLNDIVGVAFTLAAAALLVNGFAARSASRDLALLLPDPLAEAEATEDPSRPDPDAARGTGRGDRNLLAAVALAGLATGLAAGTKLSFLAPSLLLAVGIALIAPRGLRVRLTGAFVALAVLGGGYWFARNLIAVGNPIPLSSFGPLDLPSPARDFELRPGFSVLHYWNDIDVWRDWFAPGLRDSLGFLWPLTLLVLLGGSIALIVRSHEKVLRMLGAVALIGSLAYLITPLTAGGEEGRPIAFVWNLRYIAPPAALGLALLPCLPVLRRSPRRRTATLLVLSIMLAGTLAGLVQWQQGQRTGAVLSAAIALGLCLAWLLARRFRPARPLLAAAAGVALVGVLAGGLIVQRHYAERRYNDLSPQLNIAEAVRWGSALSDSSVAVAGIRGVFNQYPFYGSDLSNHVRWLGEPGPDGALLRIATCEDWREALNDGEFEYVVTMYDPFQPPEQLTDTKEAAWTRTDPAVSEVLSDGAVNVFRIDDELDPGACGELPDLSEAELNGESVNAEPLANQPVPDVPDPKGGVASQGGGS
ncbi:hypothetical protein HJD18_12805 [Thermoleophilia bacterium SCSIO 60948]|nr:hypothetical protein HJD18_12805 [Thermoleophilia bacterium SCSIO 60948]